MLTKAKYHHGDLKNALITAGLEILATEGVHALTLRKVAQRAGVSHAAPYAHFADKQALIAAISTEGFRKLYEQLSIAITPHAGDPANQLLEGAFALMRFAFDDTAQFKTMFSGALDKEKDYPAFVEISQKTFGRVNDVVAACQKAGILKQGPTDLIAVTVWGQVHGIISLVLEGQVPHIILEKVTLREMLIVSLNQLTLIEIGRDKSQN